MRTPIRATLVALTLLAFCGLSHASAQTIRGRLLDGSTGRPIDLGLVMLITEAGDSVTSTVTSRSGAFSLASPEPGTFLLLGSAWGYRETREGIFELGDGGEMTVDFRIRPEPLALDELLVRLDRPVFDHKLVRQGFVRRMQRGLGYFITPHDIEESPARETESLLRHIPGVTVRSPGLLTASMGELVKMRTPSLGLCDPILYVDGIRVHYQQPLISISTVVPLATVDAVEVYRRPAEIPVEYGVTQPPGRSVALGGGACGVLVFWTKSDPAPGRAASGASYRTALAGGGTDGVGGPLPPVAVSGEPPVPGETIRVQLAPNVTVESGLGPRFEGTFEAVRDAELVADDVFGRPRAVPLDGVEVLQVHRRRGVRHALLRGAVAGAVMGVGSWLSLRFVCGPACGRRDDAVLPGAAIGLFFGMMVGSQGPGDHWVRVPVPEPRGARPPGLGWR